MDLFAILLLLVAISIILCVYMNYSYVNQYMCTFLKWKESMKNTHIIKMHMRTLDKNEIQQSSFFEIFTLPIEYIKHILYYYIFPIVRSFMNTHSSI